MEKFGTLQNRIHKSNEQEDLKLKDLKAKTVLERKPRWHFVQIYALEKYINKT